MLWPKSWSDSNTLEEAPGSEDLTDTSTQPLPDTRAVKENPVETQLRTEPEKGWIVRGRILGQGAGSESSTDRTESRPLASAVVRLLPHRDHEPADAVPPRQFVTGDDGVFTFTRVPGHLRLQLEIDEPSSAYYTLNLRFDEPPAENLKDLGDLLMEPGKNLKIQMLGPLGKPVQNGRIQVKRTPRTAGLSDHLAALGIHESLRSPKERPGGIYVLDQAPLGYLNLEAQAPGFQHYGPLQFNNPPEEPLVIFLKEGAVISGTVHTLDHEPIAEARLWARGRGENHRVTTRSDGRFVFDSLGKGKHPVLVHAAGFVRTFRDKVPTGTENLEFTLAPAAVLSGQVVTEKNQPVANARITPVRVLTAKIEQMVRSTSNGHFELNTLPAGTYRLLVDHPDFALENHAEEFEVEVGKQEHTGPIVLRPGISVTGSVLDLSTQDPINTATVSLKLTGEKSYLYRPREASTEADGTFSLGGLSEGFYSVEVSHAKHLDSGNKRLEITRDGPLTFTFTMQAVSSVSGRITNEAGEPIAGVQLKIPRANLRKTSYETDLDGHYRIDFHSLQGSTPYWLKAIHPDYVPQNESSENRSFTLEPGESITDLDIVLTRGGSVTARVIDAMGQTVTDTEFGFKRRRTFPFQPGSGDGIYIPQRKISTDHEGRVEFPRLTPGLYDIAIWANGVRAVEEDIEVIDSQTTTEIELVLSEAEILTGRVIDDQGNPVAGAKFDPSDNESSSAHTNANGDFEVRGVEPGRLLFCVTKKGFNSYHGRVSVPPEKELVITLKPALFVTGEVFAENTEVFENFYIIASKLAIAGQNPGTGGHNVRGPSGHFEMELKPGTYVLIAFVPGFGPGRSEKFTLKRGEPLENIEIALPPEATVVGTVVTANTGEPVHGATIQLDSVKGRRVHNRNAKTTSKPDGTFRLGEMQEGEIRLTVSHPDFAPTHEKGLQVFAGQDTQVRLEMGAGGGLHGWVFKADEPLAGAGVWAQKHSTAHYESRSVATDSQGHYAIHGLSPGLYTVSVTHPELLSQATAKVEVLDASSTEFNLEQGENVRISGVVHLGGVPLRGGSIVPPNRLILHEEFGFPPNQEIKADGTYTLELPEAGQYSLLIHAEELSQSGIRVPVSIPRGKSSHQIDIELPSGEIHGTVLDKQTGEPLAKAQVFTLPTSSRAESIDQVLTPGTVIVTTDSSGEFVLSNLEAGTYTLKAFRQGYSTARVEGIHLEAQARSTNHEIELERGIAFQVRVVNENADPVPKAFGILRDASGRVATFFPSTSTKDGWLTVRAPRPGPYTLTVSQNAHAPTRTAIQVEEKTSPLTVVLGSGSVLQVQVLDNNSLPLDGARVELVGESGSNVLDDLFYFRNVTDPHGMLKIDHANPGRFQVSATQNGARSQQQQVEIVAGKTNQITVQIHDPHDPGK